MALIHCAECDRMASDQAAACPHCGAPIAEQLLPNNKGAKQPASRRVGFALGVGIFFVPVVFVWFLLRQGHSVASRVVGFAWLAVFLVGVASSERSTSQAPAPATNQSQPANTTEPPAPVLEVSAQQLAQAYERNTVAADQQFKGKRFKVSGVVDAINTDLFGKPYVTLRGGVNPFMQPQFSLADGHANFAAGLQVGQRITLLCVGKGDVAKTPMSKDCTPQN